MQSGLVLGLILGLASLQLALSEHDLVQDFARHVVRLYEKMHEQTFESRCLKYIKFLNENPEEQSEREVDKIAQLILPSALESSCIYDRALHNKMFDTVRELREMGYHTAGQVANEFRECAMLYGTVCEESD